MTDDLRMALTNLLRKTEMNETWISIGTESVFWDKPLWIWKFPGILLQENVGGNPSVFDQRNRPASHKFANRGINIEGGKLARG